MDVKGIAWVGHVYQKFEAMCLEVEEVMYQDTVKYVENQVQTVGASVKRFYSDVVQDLLPPSLLDDEKVTSHDLPSEKLSNVVICKKPITGMKIEKRKVSAEKSTEDLKISADAKKDFVHARYPGVNEDGNMSSRLDPGVKEDSDNKRVPQTETLSRINPIEKAFDKASPSYEIVEEHRSSYQKDMISTTSLIEGTRCYSMMESFNEIETEKKVPTEVVIDWLSSDNMFESIENKRKDRLSASGDLSNEPNGTSTVDGFHTTKGASQTDDLGCTGSSDEAFVSYPGRSYDCGLDRIEKNATMEQETESIPQLDETCVVVNRDELHFVSLKETKRRPYKKKIKEALSLRKRSGRTKEYEKLAVCYRDNAKHDREWKENSITAINLSEGQQSPSQEDVHEQEDWELL